MAKKKAKSMGRRGAETRPRPSRARAKKVITVRQADGTFGEGNEGGPGGYREGAGRKPSGAAKIRELLLADGADLVDELRKLRKEKSANVRMVAVEYQLNQAIGKPTQHVSVEHNSSVALFDALDEALAPLKDHIKELARKAKE